MPARLHPAVLLLLILTAACVRPQAHVVPAAAASCRPLTTGDGTPAAVSLSWVEAPDPNDRRRMSAWCSTVGPAVYAAPASTTRAPRDGLAVVSWNVHVGGGDLAAFVRDLRDGVFTDGEPVADFVLLLQEAFRAGPAVPAEPGARASIPGHIGVHPHDAPGSSGDVVLAAGRLGLATFYLPSMRNGADLAEDRGNAIVSTLPLSDLTAIELPFARQRRVAVAATVSAFGPSGEPWSLRLVSTHMDATAGASRLWLFSSGLRARQARHLADVLDGSDLPTVVGSDLNTWSEGPREAAFIELQRRFPQTPRPDGPTFGAGFRLDYVFFRLPSRWAARARAADHRFGSDHRPVVGWIRIS